MAKRKAPSTPILYAELMPVPVPVPRKTNKLQQRNFRMTGTNDTACDTCAHCSKALTDQGATFFHLKKYMNGAPAGDGVCVCSILCLIQWGTKYATFASAQGVASLTGFLGKLFR